MIKLEADKMTKAIERAKAAHPKVRVINADSRTYAVYGSRGDAYTVKFAVVGGNKLAECDCPARGLCYHITAAASVNIAVQSMRKETGSRPVSSRESLITAIKSTWSRRYPQDNLADNLMARFKKNQLEMLADDMLAGVYAAIA